MRLQILSPKHKRLQDIRLMMQWKVPLFEPSFGDAEERAVLRAVRSAWLTMGPITGELESSFAALLGVKHALAVSNCTAGLHLALKAAGVGPGDEVIVPSLSFVA